MRQDASPRDFFAMPPRAEMVSVGVPPKTALNWGFPKNENHTPEQQIGLVF